MNLAVKRLVAPLVLAVAISCDPKDTDFFITGLEGPGRGDLIGSLVFGQTPISGAKVLISGRTPDSTDTDASGVYRFDDLIAGDYAVTARSANYTCTPGQVTVVKDTVTNLTLICTPRRGNLAGTVLVNALPRAGVTVAAVQGTSTLGSAVTDMNGAYLISQLVFGAYNAVISVPAGATCNFTQRPVTIQPDSTSRADFSCTTPGAIAGVVTVDGVPAGGVSVTVSQGTTVLRTLGTSSQGAYSATGLAAGTYTVTVAPPGSATCVNNPRNVSVVGDQTTTENFACTTPVSPSFTIQFGDPPFSYFNIGPGSSITCAGFTTTPLKPGASWTATWTGPGIVGSNTRTGTLDASSKAVDMQPVSQFGTYTLNLSVTSGGFTANGSGSIDVTSAQGACPQPPP